MFDIVQSPASKTWSIAGDDVVTFVAGFDTELAAAKSWFRAESAGLPLAWVDPVNGELLCPGCALKAWFERGNDYIKLRTGCMVRTELRTRNRTCCTYCDAAIVAGPGWLVDDVASLGDTYVSLAPNPKPAKGGENLPFRVEVGKPGVWWTDADDIREFITTLQALVERSEMDE